MIAKNVMKMNGKWYKAGEEIPSAEPQKEVVDKNAGEVEINFTKTDINRMSTAELQALAIKNNIEGTNEMTGADLKKVLIEKFGL